MIIFENHSNTLHSRIRSFTAGVQRECVTPPRPHSSGQSRRKSRPHTAFLATCHAWQYRQARHSLSRGRQSDRPRLKGRSHLSIAVGCWISLGRPGSCGCTGGSGWGEDGGWGRSCRGGTPLEEGGLGGTVVLMVLRLLLLLLVVVVFALVVMRVDGDSGNGRHHSACYWEHWDGLRRGEQRKRSRCGPQFHGVQDIQLLFVLCTFNFY